MAHPLEGADKQKCVLDGVMGGENEQHSDHRRHTRPLGLGAISGKAANFIVRTTHD